MEFVPELGERIRLSKSAMSCWIELNDYWNEATEKEKNHIMKYAKWSYKHGGDVTNAVGCAFIEHIVESKDNWKVFKLYFTNEDIRQLKGLWDYCFKGASDKFIADITSHGGI